MAVYPNNVLQTVQTYNKASLALMQNLCCMVKTSNTKFRDFNNLSANLGSSVSFDIPPQATYSNGLVANWSSAQQIKHTLTCDQAGNASFVVTDQDRLFNLEKKEDDYIEVFGRSYVAELANGIEKNIALNANSSVPIMSVNNGESYPTGALHTESGPYLFSGDGNTPLTSYQQLAKIIADQKAVGSVGDKMKIYLPNTIVPSIIGSGLNQFSPERNDEIAQSWELGKFGTPPVEYYQSNLLPIQTAGALGEEGTLLTLVSTNDPTGNNVTQLTFSGAGTESNAVMAGDLGQFIDGVTGYPNVRYLTRFGHAVSSNKVQVRATSSASSSGGNVTVTIEPGLNWAGGATQNLSRALQAGMQFLFLPSHVCGLLVVGDAFYVAMPKLPEERPYDSSSITDPETGVSLRLTYGSLFGQNQMGMIYSATWGSTLVPSYSRRIIIPLSQL
jgi:hypothetical protein